MPNETLQFSKVVLNLSLTCSRASNLYYAISSEMNTVSITNIIRLQNKKGSYNFMLYLKIFAHIFVEKDFTTYHTSRSMILHVL